MEDEAVVIDSELEADSQLSEGGIDDKKTEDYDQSPKSEKQKKEESEQNYGDGNENKKLGLDWGLVFTMF